jgi:ATP-dependent DNA ligase
MLAMLTDEPFSDKNWIYERNLDGVRCLAFRKGRRARLLSRNMKNQSGTYPELAAAIEGQGRTRSIARHSSAKPRSGGLRPRHAAAAAARGRSPA